MIMQTYSARIASIYLGLFMGIATVSAQVPDSSRLSSVYLAGGAFMAADQPLFRGDLSRLAPGSPLLEDDLSDHTFGNDRYYFATLGLDISIGLLPFRTADRSGPELRLGLTYAGVMSQGAWLEKTERTPYDTLTSSQTGQQVFVDSVERSTIWVDRYAERFGINASLIWRTKGRWSLFGGVGAVGGPILNARTDVSKAVYNGVENATTNGSNGYGYSGAFGRNDGQESYRNGTGWWFAGQIPLGLDLQIARRGLFWSQLHLYYELRPQFLLQNAPELGTYSSFGIQSLFGVRLTL